MKILIVAHSKLGKLAPFVVEQAEALRSEGIEVCYFGVTGKGIIGYLRNLSLLKKTISAYKPDIVHAHYGLSGLLANLQRRVPVVTTYHGSDINNPQVRPFSKLCMALSAYNIFVSEKTLNIAHPQKSFSLLPCGVNLTELQLTDKPTARQQIGWNTDKRYVLFSSAFDNQIKNSPLAIAAVQGLHNNNVLLQELKGFTREEVTLRMCAADVLLLTSHTEGSPQVIKEAMACGLPIVSVDVGDVRERIGGLPGCYVAERHDAAQLTAMLRLALAFLGRTKGRQRLIELGLDNQQVVQQLIQIYEKTI